MFGFIKRAVKTFIHGPANPEPDPRWGSQVDEQQSIEMKLQADELEVHMESKRRVKQ